MTSPDRSGTGGDGPGARTDGGAETAGATDAATGTAAATEAETATAGARTLAGQTLAVAVREYRVLTRVRWRLGLAVLFAAFSAAVVGLAGSAVGPDRVGAVLVTLAELSVYLVPLAALALGYNTVVGADERGTLELLVSLPLPRSLVLLGKFLGRAATLVTGLTLGLAAGGAVFALQSGVAVLPAYLTYLLAAVGMGLAFLALAVLVSTVVRRKARALGAVLLVWVAFVLVYDLVALAAVVALSPPSWVLSLAVLANPVDVFRVVVLSLVPDAAGGLAAVVATTAVGGTTAALALAVEIALPVALAGRLLDGRGR